MNAVSFDAFKKKNKQKYKQKIFSSQVKKKTPHAVCLLQKFTDFIKFLIYKRYKL